MIPPNGFLFTNPIHVHKAPALPRTCAAIKKTRRIFFGAFVANRSAEYEVIFATNEKPLGPWWESMGFPKGELTKAGYFK